jgi:putative hydrolase of the HAD superfamily
MSMLRPKAVLFDLFHTLVCVPPPAIAGGRSVPEILGVSAPEWQRLYYDEDVLERCLGRVPDGIEAMRRVTHLIDPTVDDERILEAVESRRRRFEMGLINVEESVLEALDQLRAARIRTALVSDAGWDDIESWPQSPLRSKIDVSIFSCRVGYRKPDPRIYRHALAELGVSAADAVFVGDGGSDEHAGARAVGMKTVLVTGLMSRWWPEKIQPRRGTTDFEFEDVADFVRALDLRSEKRTYESSL